MKKNLIGLILIIFVLTGCSKKDSDDQEAVQNPYAVALIVSSGTPIESTSITVALIDMNNGGLPITGADVKVNGSVLTDNGDGSYTLTLTQYPILTDAPVTLTFTCQAGDFTASATMPETGSTSVTIDGCFHGSYMMLGNNI
jgi:hypothetical protein